MTACEAQVSLHWRRTVLEKKAFEGRVSQEIKFISSETDLRPFQFFSLGMEALKLWVRLGATEQERSTPQEVQIDIEFRFFEEPKAGHTDRLSDTICYSEQTEHLNQVVKGQEFCLLERLGRELAMGLKERLPKKTKMSLRVIKMSPPVRGELSRATYCIGDFPMPFRGSSVHEVEEGP